MRIIGEFDISGIKTTVFRMNERTSVKFEFNLLEQIYKFRDGSGIETTEDVRRFCSAEFVNKILEIFSSMDEARYQTLLSLQETEGEKFDEII